MRKRDDLGQFAQKSEEPREVRSIRLTDSTWKVLGQAAETQGITRADLLEKMAENGAFEQNLPQESTNPKSSSFSLTPDP